MASCSAADSANLAGATGFYSSVWRPALVAADLDDDTIETLGRTYAHWMRDDRDVPAAALSRMLRPTLAVVEAV